MKIITRFLVFLLALVLALGSNGVPFTAPMQVQADEIELQTYETAAGIVEVLEIQPGRKFLLQSIDLDNAFGSGKYRLTQLSMGELISQVDTFDGQYDVIILGNEVIGTSYSMAMQNVSNRTYFAQGDQTYSMPNGVSTASQAEFYDGNDITNLAASKLMAFIEKNQLMIFDTNVFNLNGTNVKAQFESIQNSYKVKKYTGTTESTRRTNLIYQMKNWNTEAGIAKRPKLVVRAPKSYNSNDEVPYYLPQLSSGAKQLEIEFDATSSVPGAIMDADLYIDFNADGRYTAEEKLNLFDSDGDPLNHGIKSDKSYSFMYYMSHLFTGHVGWKVILTERESKVMSSLTGSLATKGSKVNIRLLHLTPDNTNATLEIRNLGALLSKTDEYNIQVTQVKASEFNSKYPNDARDVNNNLVKTQLNGNYDMIIFGFQDATVYTINKPALVAEINQFTAQGQSVMFTHDNFTFNTNSPGSWGYDLGRYFRDVSGQNAYQLDPANASVNHVGSALYKPYPVPGKWTFGFSDYTLRRANNNTFITTTTAYKLNEGPITQYPNTLANNTTKTLDIANTHFQYFRLNLEDPELVPWFSLTGNSYNQYDARNNYYTYSKGNITYSGTGHSAPNGMDEQKMFINTILKAFRGANHAPVLESVTGPKSGGVNVLYSTQGEYAFSFKATDFDLNDQYLNAQIYVDLDATYDMKTPSSLGKSYISYRHNALKIEDRVINDVQKSVIIPVWNKDANKSIKPLAEFVETNLGKKLVDNDKFWIHIYAEDAKGAKSVVKSFEFQYVEASSIDLGMANEQKGYLVNDVVPLQYVIKPILPVGGNKSLLYMTATDAADALDNTKNIKLSISYPTEVSSGVEVVKSSDWLPVTETGKVGYAINLCNYISFSVGAKEGQVFNGGIGKPFSDSDPKTYITKDGISLKFTKEMDIALDSQVQFDRYSSTTFRVKDDETVKATTAFAVKTGSITVTTKNQNGSKVKTPMWVTLMEDGKPTDFKAMTNNGVVTFDKVPTGIYDIHVQGVDTYVFNSTDATKQIHVQYGDGTLSNYVKNIEAQVTGNIIEVVSFKQLFNGSENAEDKDNKGIYNWKANEINGIRSNNVFDANVNIVAKTGITSLRLGGLQLEDTVDQSVLKFADGVEITDVKIKGLFGSASSATKNLTREGDTDIWKLDGTGNGLVANQAYTISFKVKLGDKYSAYGDMVDGRKYLLSFATFDVEEPSVDEPWPYYNDPKLKMNVLVNSNPITNLILTGKDNRKPALVMSKSTAGVGYVKVGFTAVMDITSTELGFLIQTAAGSVLPNSVTYKITEANITKKPGGSNVQATATGNKLQLGNVKTGSYEIILRIEYKSPTKAMGELANAKGQQLYFSPTMAVQATGIDKPDMPTPYFEPLPLVKTDVPTLN